MEYAYHIFNAKQTIEKLSAVESKMNCPKVNESGNLCVSKTYYKLNNVTMS